MSRECLHLTLDADPETGATSWVLARPHVGRADHGWWLLGGVCASCRQDVVRPVFYERVISIDPYGRPRGIATRAGLWSTTDNWSSERSTNTPASAALEQGQARP